MRVFTIINAYTGALCLQELIDQGHEVVGVVTAPNFQPHLPSEQTVIGVATKNLLPLYMPTYETVARPSPDFLEIIRSAEPDLIVSMHYPAIFKPALLNLPSLGCVNIHPSKLPEGRGMTPSWWYLYLGREIAWTTLHYLDAGVDTGDVIASGSTPITTDDTGESVSKRLSEVGSQIFRANLLSITDGTSPRYKQNLSKGSYIWASQDWHRIDWARHAKGIRGQIRCFKDTENNARTSFAGKELIINDAEVANPADWRAVKGDGVPGELLAITGKGPLVQAGKGLLCLTDFALKGEKYNTLQTLLEAGIPVILGG